MIDRRSLWINHVFICMILLTIVAGVLVVCILVKSVNLVLVLIRAIICHDCRGTMYVASIIDIWPREDALGVTGVRVVLVVGWGDHRLLGRRGIVWRRWRTGSRRSGPTSTTTLPSSRVIPAVSSTRG